MRIERLATCATMICWSLLVSGCDATDASQEDPTTVQVFIHNDHTQCANNGLTLAQTQAALVGAV